MGGKRAGLLPHRFEAALQFIGEEQIGQLAEAVLAPASVAPLSHEIVEVDLAELVGVAADRNHSGPGGLVEQANELSRQCEMAEMVGTELHFEAVGSGALRDAHDPGVVDEQIEARLGFR